VHFLGSGETHVEIGGVLDLLDAQRFNATRFGGKDKVWREAERRNG
jgi:hypothetical protein